MASKSYRKFVAAGATATLVASAVAPAALAATPFKDVNKNYEAAVNYLVEEGIAKGISKDLFGTNNSIKRGDAAVMIANAIGLDTTNAPASSFKDLNDRVKGAVNALYAKGIISGKSSTEFQPDANITRAEMAKILTLAYDLKANGVKNTFTDVNSNFDQYVDALVANEITFGITEEQFGATHDVTRGQFALFIYRAEAPTPVRVPEVASVSTTNNGTSVTISGKVINASEASIVIQNADKEEVYNQNVSVSTDGTFTQTIALPEGNYTYEVVANGGEEKSVAKTGSFRVTLADAESAAVVEATYDDDIANQFVAISVDGKKVTAQELINAGYDVTFDAFDSKAATNEVSGTLFASDSTGELSANLATNFSIPTSGKEFYVKVTLTKGSEVITSPLQKITIKNLDLAAGSIAGARLLNYGTDDLAGGTDDFYQSSSTLVTGETAAFDKLDVRSGSNTEEITSGYTVKSSNPAVVSVDSNGVLTAQGPGTATVTVTYGGATYTKTITVTNTDREATRVSAEKTNVTVAANGGTATIKVKLLDQYGDPIAINGNNVTLVESNPSKVSASLGTSTDPKGEAVLTFTGGTDGAGSSTITFRDAAGVKIGSTSITANVTENGTLSQYSLAIDTDISATDVTNVGTAVGGTVDKDQISTDATLDLQSDKYLKLNLKGLNSAGAEIDSAPAAASYTVTTNVSGANVLATPPTFSADGFIVVEAGTKAGTATITVTNNADGKIVKTFRVTVTDVGYNVTGVALKNVQAPTYAQTLNYEDFLSYTEAAKDPVISGVTLSKAVTQPVRLDLDGDAGSSVGALYIDKNADGVFNNDDILVGSVTITTTGSIADTTFDAVTGVDVATGDDGTVLFKVSDSKGNVVATKAVTVEF